MYKWFRQLNPTVTLGMNTNGAIQNTFWWHEIGRLFNQPRDYVVFSIDGLEDTNSVYRKGVNWTKLMQNSQAFIEAGGLAHWDMLIYQHNEHQVDEARQLSSQLGFKEFRVKYTARFFNKKHEFIMQWPVKTKQGVVERYLELPTNVDYQNMIYVEQKKIATEHGSIKQYLSNTTVECHSQKTNHIYISADGNNNRIQLVDEYEFTSGSTGDDLKLQFFANIVDADGDGNKDSIHITYKNTQVSDGVFQGSMYYSYRTIF
jgi:sulfatase maturation enzyme AslB (radical SAM superfamily)